MMNDAHGRIHPASAAGPGQHQPAERPDGQAALSRRAFLGMVGAMAAGATLAGCTPRPRGRGPHGSDTVQLVYQDWRTEWFPGMAQQMLETFHASHPNIHVFYTPDPDNIEEKMFSDFEAGTAPDVLAGCCDFFPIWAQKGYLLDLRPYVEADLDRTVINDWDKAQYQAFFTRNGVQFALPKYHGALALYYNKDFFDQFDVDYPDGSWNHDDYLEAMKRLTADRDRDGKIDLWGSMVDIAWERIQMHVNGWGGHFVDPKDPTRSLMAETEALAAMRWIRQRMWDDHVMASFLDVQNLETRQAFIQQRLAMVEDGSWALKDILEHATFRVGVAPFPAGPARRVTLATTDGFGIYAGTKYPEAAWELLKFLVSRDYGRAMARTHLLQPARASLVDEWVSLIRNEYPDKAKDVNIAAFAEGHIQGYSVTAEVFANQGEAWRLTRAAWQQIFTLGQVPVEHMRVISDQIEQAQRKTARLRRSHAAEG
ncbi:MAG: sugar ABC transporter substrate-binding protein [Anaerolineae bacterium]|nr:sugar ABC transporter substrate-binding protein [Anaerolineae bacterium]